ncbi:MAG: LPS assembly lipoprotein LptE [Chitinophagaceae bacterium]
MKNIHLKIFAVLVLLVVGTTSCGVYSFNNTSIPSNVKTVNLSLFGNKARYVNATLAPNLTDAVRQLINNQTKLTLTEDINADYVLSGDVSSYDVSTSGISSGSSSTTSSASMNRLTVGFHLVWIDNTKEGKKKEFNVSQNFDFASSLSLDQAESQLKSDILKNVSEAIFNDVFANW